MEFIKLANELSMWYANLSSTLTLAIEVLHCKPAYRLLERIGTIH
jgi:hypothetical protein